MSNYIANDTDLIAVANAIRTKGGTSSQLEFPQDFVDAIGDIQTGGGTHVASGTFTIIADANDNAPTITHNLNTQKIAVLIYPISAKITAGDGYRNWYAELITANQIVNGETWTFDWTSYNTHFSGDEVVTLPSGELRVGTVHQSPWPTQSHWYNAGNPAHIDGLDSVVLTDNTVRVRGTSNSRWWCVGTYNWIVAKME